MSFKKQHENYIRPKQTCGIYIIKNILNNKVYIGKSIHIERRFIEHKSSSEWKRNPSKKLYQVFESEGLDNFTFDILEECSKEELNQKEQYWIKYYKSNNPDYGYNITSGGDGHDSGEKHPNHKLTKIDIINIRTRYAKHERKSEVEKDYIDKIGPSGFRKVWQGITWPDIMPEVYTEENIEFHKHNTGCPGSKNGRALLNESQVLEIRQRKKNGEDILKVFVDYIPTGIKYTSFCKIWYNRNWKHVVVE